jgi:hypothetical protein
LLGFSLLSPQGTYPVAGFNSQPEDLFSGDCGTALLPVYFLNLHQLALAFSLRIMKVQKLSG